jgi:tripartite-type tricarboxylate transporter receptor subunit TctC
MSGELFKMMTGVKMVHVPYRGGGPAVTDLLGGQVQVMFVPPPTSIEHIRSGKGQGIAAAMAQHVRMDRKRHFGASPDPTE